MKIVVLCGGTSTERDVSISSGKLICNGLNKNGHDTILLDVYLGICDEAIKDCDPFKLNLDVIKGKTKVDDVAPDINEIKKLRENPNEFFGPNVLKICKMADIVFIALHGENGENGKLQATFDLLDIKYTGSGYLGSALGMNKSLTRNILMSNGINMAEGITLKKEDTLDSIKDRITFPCVVKPSNGGSSVGVTISHNMETLKTALQNAKKYDDEIVLEKYIKGREFSVGVIDGKALPVIEIIPKTGFYDYKNKYQNGLTEEICPANIKECESSLLKESAEKVYKILGLSVYARIDFILSEDKKAYCLEANTLPGMTPTSLLPQEASVMNISYEALCEKIIELSLKK